MVLQKLYLHTNFYVALRWHSRVGRQQSASANQSFYRELLFIENVLD